MSIKLEVDGSFVEVVRSVFPVGETCLRITGERWHADEATITLNFEGSTDLIDLALLTDAVRRYYGGRTAIKLVMPYLPYAQQDRVCQMGESLSIKVVADMINSLKFAKVVCWDIHSHVGAALIDNLQHVELADIANDLAYTWVDNDEIVLVSPDAGSNKKVFDFAKVHGFTNVVRADKIRDVSSGQIVETKVFSAHVGNKDFLILDDLCIGGRTFTELAKELRKLTTGNVYLYVTHGVFSSGMDVFDGSGHIVSSMPTNKRV